MWFYKSPVGLLAGLLYLSELFVHCIIEHIVPTKLSVSSPYMFLRYEANVHWHFKTRVGMQADRTLRVRTSAMTAYVHIHALGTYMDQLLMRTSI